MNHALLDIPLFLAQASEEGSFSDGLIGLAYLVAAGLFIFGLKGLTHPRTAVRGNRLGAVGMLIAVLVTLMDQGIADYKLIGAGVLLGAVIGAALAQWTPMTSMPQMVALLNGFGGIASVLVAGGAMSHVSEHAGALFGLSTAACGLIGAVTFTGSMVAFGKLQGLVSGNAILLPARHAVNLFLVSVSLMCTLVLVLHPDAAIGYWLLVAFAACLGVLLVIPIGGADMPVVISLLNSYSGLAAAATGFVIENNVLIVAGSLVGASGIILTRIMCKAMNRSLANVLFAVMSPGEGSGGPQEDAFGGRVKPASPEDVAILFDAARRVVMVPGYGLAVAQAQHALRQLSDALEEHGVVVEYGIHPVAGRMPGHMNVLLAEAEVSYEKLKDMDQINPTFPQTDVVVVIGANDVVNPIARTDPSSPIAGMPILDVDKARTVIVVKRSMSPGFAGIPNPLFTADNTLMYFADAKRAVEEMLTAVQEL